MKIYLSYTQDAVKKAEKLKKFFTTKNISIYVNETGEMTENSIKNIKSCDTFILLLSQGATTDNNIKNELATAQGNKPICVLKIEKDLELNTLNNYLQDAAFNMDWYDEDTETLLNELLEKLHKMSQPLTMVISYASSTSEFADILEQFLREQKFTVWRDHSDENGIDNGGKYFNDIPKKIKDSDCLIVLLSKAAFDKANVADELRIARDLGKKIFGLLIDENFNPNEIRDIDDDKEAQSALLVNFQYDPWFNAKDRETLEKKLIVSIRKFEKTRKYRDGNKASSKRKSTIYDIKSHCNIYMERIKNGLKKFWNWTKNIYKRSTLEQKIVSAILVCLPILFVMYCGWGDDYLAPGGFSAFKTASYGTGGLIRRGSFRFANYNYVTSNDKNGFDTPIYWAAKNNTHPDGIRALIEISKKVSDKDIPSRQERLNHALALAAMYNSNPEVIKEFVNAGASLRYEMLDGPYSNSMTGTPLFLASKNNPNVEVVKCLLELEDTGRRKLILKGIVRCQEKNILAIAVHNSNREVLQYLLKAGADVNASNLDNETALMELKDSYGAYNAVPIQALLDAEANPNAQDNDGRTLLMRMLSNDYPVGYNYDFLTPAEVLITGGASVDIRDNKGRTVLMYAAQNHYLARDKSDVIRLFLKAGADINARDNEGNTAIILAAKKNYPNIIKLLLENGADINARNLNGRTALMEIIQRDVFYETKLEIIKLLLETGADTTIQDNDGRTALMYAILSATQYSKDWRFHNNTPEEKLRIETSIIKTVMNSFDINIQDNEGKTALMLPILNHSGFLTFGEILINGGASVDIQDNQGRNALMNVITHRFSFENMTNIELLLKAGTDINARDNDGKTALMLAAEKNYFDVIKLLIENGADINAKDNYGKTALIHTMYNLTQGNEKAVIENIKLFIQSGADINAQDNDGNTALILIPKLIIPPYKIRDALIKLLLDTGANRDLRDKSGNLAFHYALKCIAFFSGKELSPYKGDVVGLAEKGTLAQVKEALYEGAYFGNTPILSALNNPDPEVFKFILNNGIGVSERAVILNGTYRNILLPTLYHVAIRKPNPDILKFLIRAGCNLNVKYYDEGRNILMEAVRNSKNIDIIKILAESGIDLKAKDSNGKTAADYAGESEYLKNTSVFNEIMEILSPDIFK